MMRSGFLQQTSITRALLGFTGQCKHFLSAIVLLLVLSFAAPVSATPCSMNCPANKLPDCVCEQCVEAGPLADGVCDAAGHFMCNTYSFDGGDCNRCGFDDDDNIKDSIKDRINELVDQSISLSSHI